MNTNTVEISFPTPARVCGWVSRPAASMTRGRRSHCQAFALTAALALSLLGVNLPSAKASTVLGPWVPIFKGVDHAVGTNTPGGGGFTTLQVAHAIRVDLTDPDVHLFATPRIDDYQVGSHETAGLTVENFLITYKPQVAFNANSFDPSSYYLPQGTAMEAYGLLVSDGTVVSPQESASRASSIVFDANKVARIIHTNWPAVSTSGIYTAVSGEYPILIAGVNVGYRYSGSSAFIHERNPRSAYALSQDRKTLYLLAIDGRQPGYSEGALDWETAAWLIKMGAYDGINMDGGGSTSLVMVDSVGDPIKLNHSNAMADSGNERTVGAHFGIYAPPVRGFINDVVANPEDTTALITWSTTSPATSLVDYGLTPDLGSATALDLTSVTNHQVLVDGLTPGTTYYFAVESIAETTNLISPTFAFTTTNYVTTNAMFDVTYPWKYTTANLDGVSWMDPAYDDSGWSGPGPGLLWIDVRQVPDASVQPKNTQLPPNPANNNYPYITYYFRTHFDFTNSTSGASLLFSSYIDDGAIFYLNGHEIYRLNMADASTTITHSTLAAGYNCGGDAVCAIDFTVSGVQAANLVRGSNVLAVEVHNYNSLSPDITFGTSLECTVPLAISPELHLVTQDGTITLNWSRAGFVLQQADAATGPWADLPGSAAANRFATPMSASARYYRLRK